MELLQTVNKVFETKHRSLENAIEELIPIRVKEAVISGDLEKMVLINTMSNYSVLTVRTVTTIGLIEKFIEDKPGHLDAKLLNIELKKLIRVLYDMTYNGAMKIQAYEAKYEVSEAEAVSMYKTDILNTVKNNREFLSEVFREDRLCKPSTQTESISFHSQELSASRDVVELILLVCLTSEIKTSRVLTIGNEDSAIVTALNKRVYVGRYTEKDIHNKETLQKILSATKSAYVDSTIQELYDLCIELK